ncbi:helix-turn-helix transcriptional regulator [Paenibacillus daejeonensis]|uniref:helix-turn-helix transcriptional regulator n=1 Tax=Paenibacillus daejeonensis TaxID=135193 RepID=UPI00036E4E0A|nr:response regulator transcription factor [Paenibacillus daejeonensis]
MYYSLARLSALDVRWADLFHASSDSFRWHHANPYYQLIVASDAPVWIETDAGRYELRTGESLLLQPWEQHRGWQLPEKQGSFYWVQFACHPAIHPVDLDAGDGLKKIHADRPELQTAPASDEDQLIIPRLHLAKDRFRLLSRFAELVQLAEEPKGYFRFQQTLLLGEILRLIASDYLTQSAYDSSFSPSYQTYRRLVNLLNNAYAQEIAKERLERQLDRTYEYLCQVFKKYAGMTMVQYLHQLRIQRAKHLLSHSTQSVGEIAIAVGFQDAFYFSRVFKRQEGMSPLNYRLAQQGDGEER